MTQQQVGQLRVRRGRDDAGMLRQIVVLVDGDVVARLSQGQEVVLAVVPGERVVQASMDWCTSPRLAVTVQAGGEASVSVALPWSSMWRSFVTPGRALTATSTS